MKTDSIPSPSMMKNILDTLDVSIMTFDKNRKVLFSNNAATKSVPLANSPGNSMGAAEPRHFEENEYYDENGNLLEYPKGSAVDNALQGKATYDLVLEHRNKKDHTHRWISLSCVPVLDDKGEFEYGILWFRDISLIKSRENKLKFLIASIKILSFVIENDKRLQEKAKLFVPSLADWCAIDIVNDDGTTRRVALVHRDPKKIEFIKEYEKKYPPPPGQETSLQRVIRTKKGEFTPIITPEMIKNETTLNEAQKKDILELNLSSILTVPIANQDKILGVLTLAYAESGRTYTEEDFQFFEEFANHLSVLLENTKLYTEISRRDLSKDAFLASLSHELRNPLAPIRTSLELLKLKSSDPLFKDEIDTLSYQFGHMTRLLNDLLDSSRFTRGKININLEPMELIRIVEQVVKSVRPLFEESNIHLHLSYPSKQLHVSGDRTRLEQAITNILTNAVKFTPAGGSIWIEVVEKEKSVTIKIKDNGAGITEEEMRHIFEPYYQSTRVKNENSGLGIGLYLVHQIIRLHDGTIEARSEGLNTGSEFIITIPLTEPEVKTAPQASLPTVSESKIRKILVVDDNEAAADALTRLLNALGWSAAAVYSGEHTLMFLQKNKVDLIFLDIGMPQMSGYELVRLLKEHERYQNIPVVAVTGYGLEDDKIKAIQAGFSAHITKPIGARDLREILAGDIGA